MKLRDFVNPGDLIVDVGAAIVKRIRNRPNAVARRAAKTARKARRDGPLPDVDGQFFQTEKEASMNPLLLSLLGSVMRTFGPAATAYLAGLGISVVGVDPSVIVGVAVAVYTGAQLWSMGRKILRHFAEKDETP